MAHDDPTPMLDICHRITHKATTLPMLPTVVSKLLTLAPEDDDYLDEAYRLAHLDPAFSVRLIQYARVTLKLPGSIEKLSLKQAMARLGTRKIASIIATFAFMDSLAPKTEQDRELWLHSIEVAVVARKLSEKMPDLALDPELVYLAGLLHDIGRFVMLHFVPDAPAEVFSAGAVNPQALIAAESDLCGVDHVEIGVEACRHWDLPNAITDVVRYHHTARLPEEEAGNWSLRRRVCLIRIADGFSMYLINREHRLAEAGFDLSEDFPLEEDADLVAMIESDLEELFHGCSDIPEKYHFSLVKNLLSMQPAVSRETKCLNDILGEGG